MRTNWLTQDQKDLLAEIDEYIAKWPGKPTGFAIRKSKFKLYQQIVNKKKDFPDANADVPIVDGKYRGVEIRNYAERGKS